MCKMIVKEHRKRKAGLNGQQNAPKKSQTSKHERKVFLIYDRESRRDRDIIERLQPKLEEVDQRLKCSIISNGKPGFVLKSYGEELDAADKIVVLFSSDFLKSDEAIFAFEMARSICMERRENNIIIASKGRRDLPKAYAGFPRIKTTEKAWIQELIKEVHKPVAQISSNSWTHNKEGYKCINIQELYRATDRKTSTSLPTLDCLEHPPTLSKAVVERIMIWNRFRKGPQKTMGVRRTESQRIGASFDATELYGVKKTSSVRMDKETAEFLHTTCLRRRLSRRKTGSFSNRNSFDSKPSSGISTTNSPVIVVSSRHSSGLSSRPSSFSSRPPSGSLLSDVEEPPVACETSPASHLPLENPGECKPMVSRDAKYCESETVTLNRTCEAMIQVVRVFKFLEPIFEEECSPKKKKISPQETNRRRPKKKSEERNKMSNKQCVFPKELNFILATSDDQPKITALTDVETQTVKTFHRVDKVPKSSCGGTEQAKKSPSVLRLLATSKSAENLLSESVKEAEGNQKTLRHRGQPKEKASVPDPDHVGRSKSMSHLEEIRTDHDFTTQTTTRTERSKSYSGPESNIDEIEFDQALTERPGEFSLVTFECKYENINFCHRETVWVQGHSQIGNSRLMRVRKRDGRQGKIKRLLLVPLCHFKGDKEGGDLPYRLIGC